MPDTAPEVVVPPLSVSDVKAVVRHRDGYRCVECGMTAVEHIRQYGRTLEVRRVTPGSAYTIDGCRTLCIPCHGPKPKSPRGKCERRYYTVALPGDISAVVERLAREQRRSFNSMALILMERFLAREGYLPKQN